MAIQNTYLFSSSGVCRQTAAVYLVYFTRNAATSRRSVIGFDGIALTQSITNIVFSVRSTARALLYRKRLRTIFMQINMHTLCNCLMPHSELWMYLCVNASNVTAWKLNEVCARAQAHNELNNNNNRKFPSNAACIVHVLVSWIIYSILLWLPFVCVCKHSKTLHLFLGHSRQPFNTIKISIVLLFLSTLAIARAQCYFYALVYEHQV